MLVKIKMKNTIVILVLLASNLLVKAQASYDTRIAFILQDEYGKSINFKQFKEEYQLADVYGSIVAEENLKHYIEYDEKTNYFVLNITTIGPRFSFALYHRNRSMVIYLPFKHNHNYYALNFKFKPGKYLFDFSIENKEKIYFNSNMPHYIIKKVNWRKQNKKLKSSSYAGNKTYNIKQE